MAQLSPKQKCFVDEYLIDLNATQAAIRAGYSIYSAYSIGAENLTKPVIEHAIAREMAERSRRTGVNADRIINELAKIAFFNPADALDMNNATISETAARDDVACISSVKVRIIPTANGNIVEREIRTCDKLKALELLMRHFGIFDDKVTFTGALPVVITGGDLLED